MAGADQRTEVQKKTFTKWFNSHLKRSVPQPKPIVDLYQDLRTGIKFFELINVIKNEDDPVLIPPSKNPRMKLQCLENLNKILDYLKQKGVRLENIGGEDIHSGHSTLTLGLIWTIILRLQISEIEGADAKNYKAALLAWCKMKTKGYKNVNVLDFKRSWMDGLAFNALIHAHRPNLIQMDSLRPSDAIGNLRNAFSVAESIGIDSLLDAEDVVEFPDEKSIMTYLYAYYHFFTSLNAEEISGQRIATFLEFQMQIDDECGIYERDAEALLRWIAEKVEQLSELNFPNSFDAVKRLLDTFKSQYQHVEKPPRIVAKNDIESQLFKIQTLLRAGNRQAYRPVHSVQQVGEAWRGLELAETRYAQGLRDALLRLERLDKLAKKFFTKAERRDEWLDDTTELLVASDFGNTLAEVQASRQREDAMVTEVSAYTERLELLFSIAETLISENYSKKDEVRLRQGNIQSKWEGTRTLLSLRGTKLTEMLLLKRAEKDASDAAMWIAQMTDLLNSQDVGSNVDEVVGLVKAVKLEEASKDGYRATTQAHMAGHRAAFDSAQHSRIKELDDLIRDVDLNFERLDSIFAARSARLQEALDFRRFEASLKEEELWIKENMRKASSRNLGDSVMTTDRLCGSNTAQRDEISSHEESAIKPLTLSGQELLSNGNPDSDVISAHLDWLSKAWSILLAAHQTRSTALENALKYHRYAADATEGITWLSEKEVYANGPDFGKDSFASQSLLRHHVAQAHELEGFKKQISELDQQCMGIQTISLSEAVSPVSNLASPKTPAPKATMTKVKARADFKARRDRELTITKGEILVLVSTKDEKWWKVHRTTGEGEGYVPASYVKKVKESSSSASSESPTRGITSPEPVTPGRPRGEDYAEQASHIQTDIVASYQRVTELFARRRKSLEETIAYHDFCFEATELEIWLEERKKTAQDAEVGQEAEQVEMLSRKFEFFKEDVMSNVVRVDRFNELANKLIGDEHSDSPRIRDRQDAINLQWRSLQDLLAGHSDALIASGDVTQYTQGLDEMNDWMQTKAATMSDDLGHDVASVMYLQRLHKTFTSDLPAIEQKLNELEARQTKLQDQYTDRADDVAVQMERPRELWTVLSQRATERTQKLDESLALQKFLSDYRDHKLSCTLMQDKIDSVAIPLDEPTADGAVKLLETYRNELTHPALVAERDAFTKSASDLVSNNHYASEEIAEKSAEIGNLVIAVEGSLENRHLLMSQYQGLRAWQRDHAVLSSWLDRQETFLSNQDLGDSVESVEVLQKRHSEFAAGLDVHAAKMAAHKQFGAQVVEYGLDDGSSVSAEQEAIGVRYDAVVLRSGERSAQLQASAELQNHERQCANAIAWIEEQMITALEPSYNETKLLKSEVQRHETFERSLDDFEAEVSAIDAAAAAFSSACHYASETISKRSAEVQSAWQQLRSESASKAQKLKEAVQESDFKHLVADLILFCEDVERYLMVQDVGKDVGSAQELLDRSRTRAEDLAVKQEAIDSLSNIADELIKAGHFRADEIAASRGSVVDKYSSLRQPMSDRRSALQASLYWHLFQRSISEAMGWIDEKMLIATSEAFVDDLDGSGRLANEHRVINDQIAGQWEQLSSEQLATAETLLKGNHPESEKIKALKANLTSRYNTLKESSESRLLFLDDMRKTAKFFVDIADSLDWIEAQCKGIAVQDLGSDEVSTETTKEIHAEVSSNAEGHGLIVQALEAEGAALIKSRHSLCQIPPVEERLDLLRTQYTQLTTAVAAQSSALTSRLQFHQFAASVNESFVWIADQVDVAASVDIGVDRQGCEALIKQFADFEHDINTARNKRLEEITTLGEDYISKSHPHTDDIVERIEELASAWGDMAATIEERSILLANAKVIHTFYEKCEATSSRISEKTIVAGRTDYGDEFSAAESLTAEHKIFENDLEAIKKRVADLVSECDDLRAKFGQKDSDLADKLSAVTLGWAELQDLTAARRAALEQSLDVHRFLLNHVRVLEWVTDVSAQIAETVPSDELDHVEALRLEHDKLKAEIDARADDIEAVVAEGNGLVEKHPSVAKEITEQVENLRARELMMVKSWEDCDTLLRECNEGLVFDQDSMYAEALLKDTQKRLDAAIHDPAQASSAEILELMENVQALERAIQANNEQFLKLQDLTEAERVELVKTGGVDAVKEYEKTIEAARLQKVQEAEAAAAEQERADNLRKEALAEAEEERRAEEAQRAHRRAKEIADRAAKRKSEQEARRKASADLAARMSSEAEKRRATASESARQAEERRATLRHASDARVASAAAKIAAARKKAQLQTLKAVGSSEA